MSKTYLCVFEEKIDREELTKFLDTKPAISFWFHILPNSIFIESNWSTKEISHMLESKFGSFRHIVVEANENWGRLPKKYWEYLK